MTVFLLALAGCSWIGGEAHDADLTVWSVVFDDATVACGEGTLELAAATERPDGTVVELTVDAGGTEWVGEATSSQGRLSWSVTGLDLDGVDAVDVHLEGQQAVRDEVVAVVRTGESTFYGDGDGDGYGAGEAMVACDVPTGHVVIDGDCDDSDPSVSPAEPELCGGGDEDCDGQVDEDPADAVVGFVDGDGDGFAGTPSTSCDAVLESTDCDDTDAAIRPTAAEVCGGVDEDCDGLVDDDDPDLVAADAMVDVDGDGHAALDLQPTCNGVTGLVADDCDDADPSVYPGRTEVCDGVDNDCNGLADDDDPHRTTGADDAWYPDEDGDGLGLDDVSQRVLACEGPDGFIDNDDDCDDQNELVGAAVAYFLDLDEDGAFAMGELLLCEAPSASFALTVGDDCDDLDGDRYPGAPELCDQEDDDCDGMLDEDPAPIALDSDGDHYGGEVQHQLTSCPSSMVGYSQALGDCDDGNPTISPGASELCDGIDNDCADGVDVGAPDGFLEHGTSVALATWTDVLADQADAYTVCGTPSWSGQLTRDLTLDLVEDAVIAGRVEVSGASLTVLGGALQPLTNGADGGSIHVQSGTLALTGVAVTCAAPGTITQGGAIAASASPVTLTGTTVEGCGASRGGALWAQDASVTLVDAELAGNRANNGGALYLQGNQGLALGGLTAFEDNFAHLAGGALYLGGPNTTLTTQNGADPVFHGNTALEGGAIYSATNLTLGAARYEQNDAERGGALFLDVGAPLVQGTFSDNVASLAGGAVFVSTHATLATGVNGSFSGNRVGADCGALHPVSCTGNGGAIAAEASVHLVEGATFSDNVATEGGAVAVGAGILEISGGTAGVLLAGNSAVRGNALAVSEGAMLTDATFAQPGSGFAYVLLSDPATLDCDGCDTGDHIAVEFDSGVVSGPFSPGSTYTCQAALESCMTP